ncbi:hypothetical protein AB0N05_22100 [Nocardia sp. NPDC051030]|uniref:hypothetical protein n=1 Tax=Nocardia sp. NPDC051030 TaxID=3155162 RepID=UPI00342BB250
MIGIWMYFFVGMIAGGALGWVASMAAAPGRVSTGGDGWTVAAIASRIEQERDSGIRQTPCTRAQERRRTHSRGYGRQAMAGAAPM